MGLNNSPRITFLEKKGGGVVASFCIPFKIILDNNTLILYYRDVVSYH